MTDKLIEMFYAYFSLGSRHFDSDRPVSGTRLTPLDHLPVSSVLSTCNCPLCTLRFSLQNIFIIPLLY